nr:reverse transcriptase domain-containing protein [Tanacetum cinerariifolium]
MEDNQTMEELLQAPTEGYGEAIVVPEINADHFKIKTNLLQMVQANPYHGFERENPHTHINNFKRITTTLKFRDVPNDVIKLMMFPYLLDGAARVWYDKEPPNSLLTWEDIKVVTSDTIKAVEESCVTCGANHAYYNCDATNSNQSNVCTKMGTYNQGKMKAITTRSGVSYEGPSIPTNPFPKKVVERETEETTDKEQTNFQGNTAPIQHPVIPILEPDVLKTLPKPNIPYPSRLNDQKLREKVTNQMEKFFQIFQDMHFDISFTDALLLMPKFSSTIKSLLGNKDKLFELAKISLNENFSEMLLKKLPEKLGDSGKFLILCDFPRIDMTLELADRSITRPKGFAEDVFVKVGKFHFPTDFVVVEFEADPRVLLILGRSFLRTGRALIDVYGEKIMELFSLGVFDDDFFFILEHDLEVASHFHFLEARKH